MLLQAYLYLWIMTVSMIQFETLPALLILSNAGSSSSSSGSWTMRTPALVDLRHRSFIMIKFSRTVPNALAYKQLTKLRQVYAMFCCRHFYCVLIEPHCRHESTEFSKTRTDQSKRAILIHHVLMGYSRKHPHTLMDDTGNPVINARSAWLEFHQYPKNFINFDWNSRKTIQIFPKFWNSARLWIITVWNPV